MFISYRWVDHRKYFIAVALDIDRLLWDLVEMQNSHEASRMSSLANWTVKGEVYSFGDYRIGPVRYLEQRKVKTMKRGNFLKLLGVGSVASVVPLKIVEELKDDQIYVY